SGKVLVAGGWTSTDTHGTASAELYDPSTGTWASTGSMSIARVEHTATRLVSGKVLVAGGATATGESTATAELYDPATGTWSPTGSMNVAPGDPTATLLPSGKVLVASGKPPTRPSPGTIATVHAAPAELYDPST